MCDVSKTMIYKPLSAQFEITEKCTHKCRHCYNFYEHNFKGKSTNEKVIDKVAEQELFDITLTGGDPLFNKPMLYNAIEKFKGENMDVRINSNLHLLTENDADKIVGYGVDSVLSSILGNNAKLHDYLTGVNGSFDVLKSSLEKFSKRDYNVAMNMVVNQNNKNEVYDTAKYLIENFKVNYFCATPVVASPLKGTEDMTLTREEYVRTLDTLLKIENDFGIKTDTLNPAIPCMFPDETRENYRRFFENRSCAAAKGTVTFSVEGDVRVCSQESKSYGNIFENSLEKILETMSGWREGNHIPEECSPCDYLTQCRGGCRVSAEAHTGKLNGLEPYFTEPIKNRVKTIHKKEKIVFDNLISVKGSPRLRNEDKGLTTIYFNAKSKSIVTNTEKEIFTRFLQGKSYSEVLNEVKNKPLLDEICSKLHSDKILFQK